ncbi:hypothetical protein PMAYCL1PPCAC_01153, partial [Pristionchus mayeri]
FLLVLPLATTISGIFIFNTFSFLDSFDTSNLGALKCAIRDRPSIDERKDRASKRSPSSTFRLFSRKMRVHSSISSSGLSRIGFLTFKIVGTLECPESRVFFAMEVRIRTFVGREFPVEGQNI